MKSRSIVNALLIYTFGLSQLFMGTDSLLPKSNSGLRPPGMGLKGPSTGISTAKKIPGKTDNVKPTVPNRLAPQSNIGKPKGIGARPSSRPSSPSRTATGSSTGLQKKSDNSGSSSNLVSREAGTNHKLGPPGKAILGLTKPGTTKVGGMPKKIQTTASNSESSHGSEASATGSTHKLNPTTNYNPTLIRNSGTSPQKSKDATSEGPITLSSEFIEASQDGSPEIPEILRLPANARKNDPPSMLKARRILEQARAKRGSQLLDEENIQKNTLNTPNDSVLSLGVKTEQSEVKDPLMTRFTPKQNKGTALLKPHMDEISQQKPSLPDTNKRQLEDPIAMPELPTKPMQQKVIMTDKVQRALDHYKELTNIPHVENIKDTKFPDFPDNQPTISKKDTELLSVRQYLQEIDSLKMHSDVTKATKLYQEITADTKSLDPYFRKMLLTELKNLLTEVSDVSRTNRYNEFRSQVLQGGEIFDESVIKEVFELKESLRDLHEKSETKLQYLNNLHDGLYGPIKSTLRPVLDNLVQHTNV